MMWGGVKRPPGLPLLFSLSIICCFVLISIVSPTEISRPLIVKKYYNIAVKLASQLDSPQKNL